MARHVAYLDDSGTHANSPLAVVAGAVGTLAEWARLSRLWNRELKREGLEFFRMADFVSSHGPYRGWDERRKHRLLLALVKLIRRHTKLLIGSAVCLSDFKAAFTTHPTPCIKDAYHFCAVMTLPMIGCWEGRQEPVILTFEAGNKLLDEYFRLVQKDFLNDVTREAYGIAEINIRGKKDNPPLQAADVIAYGAWKCATQERLQPYLANAHGLLWKVRNCNRCFSRDWICRALAATVDDLAARPHLYRGMFNDWCGARSLPDSV